jgi:superfamily II DNA or RNA helicase
MLCKNATYRFGLTGTVDKKDEINMMRLFGCMGEIVIKISNDFLIEQGHSAKPTIYLETISSPKLQGLEYKDAYEKGIVENELRNEKIASKVTEKYNEGKGCLVIVNRKKHGETLKKLLEDNDVECEFTHGSFSGREEVLEDMKKGKLKVLIATTILDEGVDVSGISCLWMAAGGKSFRQVLQRIGRGLRRKDDGSGLEVYDFLDFTNEHLTNHTNERYQYYKDEKFEIKKV